jgi:hemoglobin/transferrin/lactoferrin receptor protein
MKVQAMQNKDRAYIYGFSSGFEMAFTKELSFKGTINYTYGRYENVKTSTVVPLDHIPPVFGQTSLFYKKKKFAAEFYVRYNGAKRSSEYSNSGEDNAQYSADAVNGYMPAWMTVNARVSADLYKGLKLALSCENITDVRYRVFASGINAPGRNFLISLRYKL